MRNYKDRYEQEPTSDLEPREKRRSDTHNALLNRRRSLDSTLSEFGGNRFVNIPFWSFENVSQDILERARVITELESTGVVEPSDIVASTRHVIELLDETMENVETVRVPPEKVPYLGLMAHEDNANIVNGEYDSRVHGDEVGQASGKFNRDNDDESVPIQDGYSLRTVGLYTKICPENTSEFGRSTTSTGTRRTSPPSSGATTCRTTSSSPRSSPTRSSSGTTSRYRRTSASSRPRPTTERPAPNPVVADPFYSRESTA
jgi:hypothetical protein